MSPTRKTVIFDPCGDVYLLLDKLDEADDNTTAGVSAHDHPAEVAPANGIPVDDLPLDGALIDKGPTSLPTMLLPTMFLPMPSLLTKG